MAKRLKKQQRRNAAKLPSWMRDRAASKAYDKSGYKLRHQREPGTFGPASEVRHILKGKPAMLKPDLERHAGAMAEAIGEALRRLRPGQTACWVCREPAGRPHTASCVATPLIHARGAYRMAEAPNELVLE